VQALSLPVTEDELVAAITQALGEQPRALRVGIGDDAAAWKPARSHLSLITTDALVDDVHFRLAQTTPEMLGHKALAVNLSDIAAMGGRPVLAVVALGVTDDLDEAWARRFYQGMSKLARRARCTIAGGDIVRAPALTIMVTVVGEVRQSSLRLRSGARPGDFACVSGPLGLSAAYLRGLSSAGETRTAYEAPSPRLAEGKLLGASRAVHAMMDISDGLSLDASRMARASGLDVCLDLAALRAHRPGALDGRSDALELMLSGGDDYELLAAVDPRAYANLARRYRARFGRELWVAGRFESGQGKVWTSEGGERQPHEPRGYDHLKRQRL
jgi:thiamine-monophosphate kinase